MKKLISLFSVLLLHHFGICQMDKFELAKGNKAFIEEDYDLAAEKYSEAAMLNKERWQAEFNLGNVYFKQEKFPEAASQFERVASNIDNKTDKAKAYHNMGNALLMEKKLEKSIEAYKNALRNNPSDNDTRYNLAVAQKLLKEQQQNPNQDQKNQDQNQDKEKEENKEKQENQDKGENKEENKENQDKQDKKDENGADDSKPENGEEGEKGEDKMQQIQMSKEDAERLLESLENKEKELQQQLMKNKLKGEKRKIDKDW